MASKLKLQNKFKWTDPISLIHYLILFLKFYAWDQQMLQV